MGLCCGKDVVIDTMGVLHGDVFNKAYHFGEDVCEKSCVLVGPKIKQYLQNEKDFANATFTKQEEENCYKIEGNVHGKNYEMVETSDARYLEPNIMCLAKRHSLNVDL